MLSELAKGFESWVWCVQVAHLHNVARALSSLSRCFQLSINLDRDFFRYLWYCGKKQIECRWVWHWWNSTDWGLCINWHVFFLPNRMQKLLLVYYYYSAKSCCKPNLESTSKYDFFPRFWGGKWRRSEHAHASYPGLFFSPARVQPLYEAGRKESSGTGLTELSKQHFRNNLATAQGALRPVFNLEICQSGSYVPHDILNRVISKMVWGKLWDWNLKNWHNSN